MNPRNFFAELKRRNVYKVAVAYAVVAWLLMQIATQIFPFFEIPNWAVRLVVLLLILGFPVALVLAWAFEITPEGIKREEDVLPNESITPRTGRKLIGITISLAAIAAGLLLFRMVGTDRRAVRSGNDVEGRPSGPSLPVGDKSIAVLPFENLSEDKANAFFASGIQDEILTALSRISGLKVISRTSTAGYEHRPENLPEIGRALGVAHILEGTVQKVGEKVHVNVQLIRADSDAHVWAQSYDRGLADIFAVEAEVARTVADELRTTLSPEEHSSVEKKPTDNAEAYTWYLKGLEAEAHPDISLTYFRQAEDYYTRAVALDPKFALARAHLAHMIAQTYHEFEPTAERSRRARAEAEEALRLNPNLGEAHLALADWFYWIAFDYDAALHELDAAEKLLPNSLDVALGKAAIRRRQGRWRESIQHHERAIQLDPRSAGIITELIYTKFYLRDWEGATALAKQALSIDPTAPTCITFRSFAEYWRTGDPAQGEAMFDKNRTGPDVDNVFFMTKFEYAMIRRDFARAEQMLTSNLEEVFSIPSLAPVPRSFLEASIALGRGDNASAMPYLEKAAAFYEKLIAEAPDDANRRAAGAMVYAYLGRKEDALREIDRARALRSETKDMVIGRQISAIRALILARIGEADQATSEIERLLTLSGPVDFWYPSITQVDLKNRWIWDPLRNDPRFQKILASPEPKTIYN